ncbi:MAG TPA: AAA family ATPase [Polyangiales bacterium]|nr:AAA family ATPase [Polyangiales bacterium]
MVRCSHCASPLERIGAACVRCDSRAEAERRDATVLFCDLGDYTQWMGEDEPEEVASALDQLKRRALEVLEAHGGLVNQFVGDEVMGLFGVGSAHEDDACRAVAAALALHAFARSLQVQRSDGELRSMRLHTGIESGVIYARARDLRAGLYDVTGDAVNTAARLRSVAELDEIIVGPEARRRVAQFFELERHAVTQLRGKRDAVVLHRVLGPARDRSFFEIARARGLTGYFGRAEPLRWLLDCWDQARSGDGLLASVGGAPGIGKTRLLYELRQRVAASGDDVLFLHGRCLAYGDIAPYQPFSAALAEWLRDVAHDHDAVRQRLRSLSAELEPDLPLLMHLLASLDGATPNASGEQLRDATVEVLTRLLLLAARDRPVLLLFEDWHWADAASRDALRMIVPRLAAHRVLIVVNYRMEEIVPGALPAHTRELVLEPLTAAEAEAIALGVLQVKALPDELCQLIQMRAHGNPFFVEEVCRSLREEGVLQIEHGLITSTQPLAALHTPLTIQAIVRTRIDRLSSRHRQILRLASVIGSVFTRDLVEVLVQSYEGRRGEWEEHASQPPSAAALPIDRVLDELRQLNLLEQQEPGANTASFQFKHAITLEVSYAALPLDQRRFHHGVLAHKLEDSIDAAAREMQAELLAHHYAQSAEREKAIEYTLLAAGKAWRAFSPKQAELQYQRAVELIDTIRTLTTELKRQRVDTSLEWVRVALYNPTQTHVDALRRSIKLSEEIAYPRGACLSLHWLSWVEHTIGNLNDAIASSHAFLDAANQLGDPALVSQALSLLAFNQYFAGDYPQAIVLMERGLSMRERHSGAAYRYAQGQFAMILADCGEFARAEALMQQALTSVTEMGMITMQAPLLVQRACIEAWQGKFEQSAETAHSANEIAIRIEARYIQGMSLFQRGYAVFMARGELQGIETMRCAIEMLAEANMQLMLSLCHALLAEALILVDDLDAALACAFRALARAEAGDRLGEITAHRVAGIAFGRRGDYKRAEQHLQSAIKLAEARGASRELAITQYCAAEVFSQTRQSRDAAEMLEDARSHLADLDLTGETFQATPMRRE